MRDRERMRWQRLADVAQRQHGVVSRRQLVELGFSDRSISRLAAERGWQRPHAGVFVLPGVGRAFPQRVLAVQHSLSVESVATGATAAHLYGLRPAPATLEFLIGEHDRVVPPAGTRLTRTRTLLPSEITEVHGIRVATGARMLIDYAAYGQPFEVRALLIDTMQRRLVNLAELADRLGEIGPVRGRGLLKRLAREQSAEHADSVFEAALRRLIRRSGLPRPAPHPWPVDCDGITLHADIAWPDLRVAVEADGFAFHSTREQLERDHRRGNALANAGWIVIRVGWSRLERDPDGFVRELRAVILRRLEDPGHIRPRSSNSGLR